MVDIVAYSTSDNARHCRRAVLTFDGPWPGLNLPDVSWCATPANSPDQGSDMCWRIWAELPPSNDEYAADMALIGIELHDDTGLVDDLWDGAWAPYGAFRCATIAAPSLNAPKRPFVQRIWRTFCALFKGAQEIARCGDE